MRRIAFVAGLCLVSALGCARIEHASDIGTESEQISLYVQRHHVEARLAPENGYDVAPGENHVVIGFWLRPGGRKHYQFHEDVRIEYEPQTGKVVRGEWRSEYYNVGQGREHEAEVQKNHIVGGVVYMPRDDGGAGAMTLTLDHEWWRTTPVVEVKFRKFSNPSRFPTE